MDYAVKIKESRTLIDQGFFNQAVITLALALEHLYLDFYQDFYATLAPDQKQAMAQQELDWLKNGTDKNAIKQGFTALSLGGKAKFFHDLGIVRVAEQLRGADYPHFRSFDSRLFTSIRNRLAHNGDASVDRDEAELFYSQMRVLLTEVDFLQRAEPVAATTNAALMSWKEAGAIPHEDIRRGDLRMDTYAANLWGVARSDPNTPEVYRNAKMFFAQTYLTRALHSLLTDVLKVMAGQSGDHVLQLRTPFGGGKTHSLIALYHITRHRSELGSVVADLPDPGESAVAAIQCEKFDVLKGRDTPDGLHIHTLWGEIAYQLGASLNNGPLAYEYVRASDESLTAPAGEIIGALLRDLNHPSLILLDEVLNHIENAMAVKVRDSTLGRQLMLFIKNLTEEVAALPHSVLVYSLQASVREAVGAEGLLNDLDHLVSRVDAKREPVTGEEILNVVQRRLFAQTGDEANRQTVAAAYGEAYRKARQAVGGLTSDEQHQVAEAAQQLADRILQSYPLHPDLLDLMYHRWGSLPSYQRTRGALQFLASVVYDLYHNGRDLQPLIGVGDVPLNMVNTRNAFFTQVGERETYNSVMDADLTGSGARVRAIDSRIATDSPGLQRFQVGTRLAVGIMLYSFGAREGEERGVAEPDLMQSVLVPGLDRLSMRTALDELRQGLLYMHYTGRRYRFETQPNLNKLIDDETRKFTLEEVEARIRTMLDEALRGASGVILWPESSGRINDRVPLFQVAYMPLDWAAKSDESALIDELGRWLEYCDRTRREYKNGLAFAIPGYMAADTIKSAARESMAIVALIKDKNRFNFNVEQLNELTERGRVALERLKNGILSLYDKVAVPVFNTRQEGATSPYTWRTLDLRSRSESNPYQRVIGVLKEAYLLFDTIQPDKIISLVSLGSQSAFVETGALVNGFFAYLNFTRLTSAEALRSAIAKGVTDRKFGYTSMIDVETGTFPNPSLVYVDRGLPASEVDLAETWIIDIATAREAVHVPAAAPQAAPVIIENSNSHPAAPATYSASTITSSMPHVASPGKTVYTLSATTDKAKAFKLFKAVQNLIEKASRLHLELHVQAESDAGFDPIWLRNAVEEPLDEADIKADTQLE